MKLRWHEQIDWVDAIPFFLVHAAAVLLAFYVGVTWKLAALCAALYFARMAAITIGFHRYFAHRSFKTSRPMQFVLALLSETSAQKGVLWWAANHRDHHRYSDQEGDIHSPKDGFFWSHVGWILSMKHAETGEIRDFSKYPELRWLNEYHLVPAVVLALTCFFIGGLPALTWGFFVSTVLLWHGTFLVNSLNHIWGTRRYATTDTSRNNALLALLTCGEGWHNNHHHFMSSANQGFFWWEIDVSYYLIRAMQLVGLVWEVRTPPAKLLAEGRVAPVGELHETPQGALQAEAA